MFQVSLRIFEMNLFNLLLSQVEFFACMFTHQIYYFVSYSHITTGKARIYTKKFSHYHLKVHTFCVFLSFILDCVHAADPGAETSQFRANMATD